MNLLTEYRPGTYWKRRRVEPYLVRMSDGGRTHKTLEVGTFIEIAPEFRHERTMVSYFLVTNRNVGEMMTDKMFGIYFERVVTMSELGLIKLIEQPDS
jgi:hypothetical protein